MLRMIAQASPTAVLAHDDPGGPGPLVVCLPGAGDVRSEYRLLAPLLKGMRVVTADLPGHGGSLPAPSYGLAQTAGALLALIDGLGAGPAVVVGCSFAPAAALWAAAERPDAVRAVVALSPHLEGDDSLKGRVLRLLLSALLGGPWAGRAWGRFYRSWYKAVVPDDLASEIAAMRRTLSTREGRRAVRQTLTASRQGLDERLESLALPTLTVFGSADDHFPDPGEEAQRVAARLRGASLVVPGAGHYPHVEQPEAVAAAIRSFVGALD